jgi:hypothetical protein
MADDWTRRDTLLVVGLCSAGAVAVGGYYLYQRHEKAKGLDFVERETHAQAAARAIASDAELSRAEINYVSSNGHVELPTKPVGSSDTHTVGIQFYFRSPKLAAAPATGQLGAPAAAGNAAGAGCIIEVDAYGPGTRGPDNLRVHQRDGDCGESMPTPPRCSLAKVWAIAISRGAPNNALADIELDQYRGKRRWTFKITDWNKPGAMANPVFQTDIDDDCPP